MSTIVKDASPDTDSKQPGEMKYLKEDGTPNVAVLQDRTPEWLKANTSVVWIALALAGLYIFSNLTPVWHTDLWGHLNYGRWIVENKAVPTIEPTMPLAKGMPFIDLPWLSQVIGFGLMQAFGVPAIQMINGLCIVTVAGLLSYCIYNRTCNLGASLLTLFAFYWGAYQQLLVVRPQLGGMVCFAAVFMMVTSKRWRRWYLVAIPVVFAFWANLHGSFFVGLLMLGAMTVGQALDVWRRSRKLKLALLDSTFRNLLLSLQLAAVAVLLNPYGLAAYAEVFAVSGSANLETLLEWQPLTLRMKQGRAAFCIAAALIAMYRFSPRRVTLKEVLLVGGLGIGMLWHSRMITWWAPVAAYYLGLHAAAVWKQYRGVQTRPAKSGGLWTVITLGIAWIAFAYTPFGIAVTNGAPKDLKLAERRFRSSVSPLTPIDITDYLNRHPPQGQIFNTYEWGDYLQWAGPKGLQVFVNSHAHLVPEEVWQDYLTIAAVGPSAEEKLKRYGVNAVVVDSMNRQNLIQALEQSPDWEKKYSDSKGAVFFRKTPIQ